MMPKYARGGECFVGIGQEITEREIVMGMNVRGMKAKDGGKKQRKYNDKSFNREGSD